MTRGLLLLAFLLGAARPSDAPLEYAIGPRDLLEIRVVEVPELNVERRVTETGSIDLPMLGDVPVSGMTAAAARGRIESALKASYVRRASVSVVVKEFASKPVSVVGAVARPGNLPVSGRWTLPDAISAAGGLTEKAGKKIYVLRRKEGGEPETIAVDTDDLQRGSSSAWKVEVLPADVVQVPARATIRVFCLGEVKQPGALDFDSDDRISLLSVLARAGGLTDRASSSIRIKRRGADGRDVETVVNYHRIVDGKDPDPSLHGDEVVIVKESFF